MRNLLIIGAFAVVSGVMPAFAQAADPAAPAAAPTPPVTFTGNIAITSDYMFRGISQSNRRAAVQGGFDLTTAAGWYAGTWLSSIDFNDKKHVSTEWDVYGGYTNNITKELTYNVGVYGYLYPASASEHFNYWEVYGGLGYDFGNGFTTGLQVNYSPDYFAKSGDSWYTQLNGAYKINDAFSLSAAVGYQTIGKPAAFGTSDYTNWNLGVTYNIPGVFKGTTLDIRYYDTDDKAFGVLDDSRGVVTIKRTM